MAELANPADTYQELVSASGEIAFPADFQTQLIHLGTNAVMGEGGEVQNLNGIYTQKLALEAFNQTGEWPDGTVFFKDIKFAKAEKLNTGTVYHQQGSDIFFVMVKDTRGRFVSSPHWSDGWGWAMFDPEPKANVSPNSSFCKTCHAPRQHTDWLYIDQYPALIAPKHLVK
ncbi:hypothetical protein GCM10007895_08420 [Paraferrimonas sedimenticola]|uniref:Cytochrome P460 domain-containing protein n=2 Tax=Paraferrimonas sedimenticola TaxID=375674 RepID=A0AA37RUG8_9GAMM|nr:hypothetical protein GCM10007895_08420 [Paraferrimonas sedimenticola]